MDLPAPLMRIWLTEIQVKKKGRIGYTKVGYELILKSVFWLNSI